MWSQLEKKPLTRLGRLARAKTHEDILNLVDAYDEQQHDCLLRWEVVMMMSAMVNKWNNVGLHPIIVLTHLTQSQKFQKK